jgi:hypothetical protein
VPTLAGAPGLKGDFDDGKTSLADGIKLRPEMNSIADLIFPKQW